MNGSGSEDCPVDFTVPHGARVNSDDIQVNIFQESPAAQWPHQVGTIPSLVDRFQGREEEIPKLVTKATKSLTRVALFTHVLCGPEGVGKTWLAAAYAQQVWETQDLDLLVWATASSRNGIQSCYARVAAEIGQLSPLDAERAAKWFLGFLQVTTRSWLVVLDDLQDSDDVQDLLPVGPGGQVLVTTPHRDAVPVQHGCQLIMVGPYTRAEALAYLHEGIKSSHDHGLEQAAGLAIDLGHLPLALAQAAAFINDRLDTCAEYRRRLRDQRQFLSDMLSIDTLADHHQFTIAATRAISVELADLFAPVGLAEPILQLASVLDPNGAPIDIFTTHAALTFIGKRRRFPAFGADEPHVDYQDSINALENLQHLKLLSLDRRGGRRVVRTHKLVQRASLESLADDVLAITVRVAADAIIELWPDIEREFDLGRTLQNCALALKERYSTLLWFPDGHPILFRTGRSLGECGLIDASINYWAQLAAEAASVLGSDHPHTLIVLGNLAYWRSQAGDATDAVAAFEQLLSDYLRVLGPDHAASLGTRSNLAYWRGEDGDPAGAAAAFEELASDYLRVLGPDHPDTLITRSNLARWRGEAGDPAAAAAAFKQLLTDRLRLLGPDHPYVLATLNNLIHWRGQGGDPAGAAADLELLVTDHLRVLGPNHPDTLITRSNLARWRGEAGDPAAAAAAFEELATDYLRVLGPNHPDTLITRSNLARWRGEAGDPAAAAAAFKQLVTDYLRVLGPDHPHTLTTRSNLAQWQGEAGDPAAAAEALEVLIMDYLRVLGSNHPHTLTTRSNIDYWRYVAAKR